MITHEEVREHLGMWSRKARPLMRQYITQQEKKDKLLELLLKLDDCISFSDVRDFYEKHGDEIRRLRKELESELK